MNEKPEIKLTKGGNKGGRRSLKKFGDDPNSIQETLAFMPAEVQRKYRENMAKEQADAMALERWAANDFHSGYEVL